MDILSVFNIIVGILVLLGVVFIRNDNQKGLFYKLSQ
jgi:hypothetical protein